MSGYRHIASQFNIAFVYTTTGFVCRRHKFLYHPIKKDERRETGMTTENMTPKAVADCTAGSGKIAAQRNAKRTRARITISTETQSYLALNWQRAAAGVRNASSDRRFTTPQSIRSHVFDLERWAFWYRLRNRSRLRLKLSRPPVAKGGRGDSRDVKAQIAVTVRSDGIFGANGSLAVFLVKKIRRVNDRRSNKRRFSSFTRPAGLAQLHRTS